MKIRGFEVVKGYEDKGINLPVRKTKHSAGYDIEAAEDVVIPKYYPGIKPTLIPTGLKAYCADDECFFLLNRSSGPKKGFLMANSIGLVDKDYYGNSDNDGDAIGQVVFQKYLVADNDEAEGVRTGGFGSTDKEEK